MNELKSSVITRDGILNGKLTGHRPVMIVESLNPKRNNGEKLLKLQTGNLKWISVYFKSHKVDTKSQMYR